MAGITTGGIGSGIDVTSLVAKLVAAEAQPKISRLDRREASTQAQVSAVGNLKAAVAEFQSALESVANYSSYNQRLATNTDNDIFSISANNQAQLGNFAVEVKKLATSQKLSSSSFGSSTEVVGTGTLTFRFGTYDDIGNTFTTNSSKSIKSVVIDSAHQTVEGIRDAVNAANFGVSASIISDGSGKRLVFTSNESGAANSLKITVTDGDTTNTNTSGLSKLAFDPTATAGSGKNMSQTMAAQNAELVVDGIDVESASNVVTDVINGVTLNLKKEEEGTTAHVSVSLDKFSINAKAERFVKGYNTLIETIDKLSAYDPKTKKAGILNGDSTTRSLESALRTLVSSALPHGSGAFSGFYEIGIKTASDGKLKLDATKLSAAAENHFEDVIKVFAEIASPTDAQVSFSSATKDTQAGSYLVNVSQIARQGNLVGSAAANLTISAGVNDTLVFQVDGTNATIQLAAGTYTADELATEVAARVNGVSALSSASKSVVVTQSAGVFTLKSHSYGAASSITLVGGNGKDDFIGLAPTATVGADIVGSINGVAATGNGKFLTGTGKANGLRLEIDGGATGSRGSVRFTRGIANQVSRLIDHYLDADGAFEGRSKFLSKQLESISVERSAIDAHMTALQKRLSRQFNAMDELVGKFKSTSDYLAQQLQSLSKNSEK